ncbi:hypothetical protein [Sorangium sp. So ce1182]
MVDHTSSVPRLCAVLHDLPAGLSLELWFVNGEFADALWLFCDR